MAFNTLKSSALFLAAAMLPVPVWCEHEPRGNDTHGGISRRELTGGGSHLRKQPKGNFREADFTQAEMMLNLLRASVGGRVAPQAVESLLKERGTTLIIQQQNISRAVTEGQYRSLLSALSLNAPPDITPVDAGERGRRGAEGLRKDVWQSLRWGRENTDLLATRLAQIRGLDLARGSKALALRFLPKPVRLSPRLYVVMGGRAGAAALEGDEIYFDVLATSYRASNGELQYPTPPQIVEYFAHETHHVGLSQILNRTRQHLRLDARGQRAFLFLTALIMEGSASYLINGHRSLEVMRRDPQFAENLRKGGELLRLCEQVLQSVLENGLEGEAYEKATAPFLGSGWHSAGATMLAVIDEVGGLRAVMRVLRDPRKLLISYNRAAAKLKPTSGLMPFDSELAKKVSLLGG